MLETSELQVQKPLSGIVTKQVSFYQVVHFQESDASARIKVKADSHDMIGN